MYYPSQKVDVGMVLAWNP